ncbi:MAG: hypothetical protein ACJ8AJ_11625 [Gemmatimonadaceae bacterium]
MIHSTARILLFIFCSFLGGLGGALGSIVGHAIGPTGLWVGGILGGLLGAIAATAVARARRWIAPEQFGATAAGASVGFLLAALIAVKTLGSPIGPILSTGLVGLGALLGARVSRTSAHTHHDHAA